MMLQYSTYSVISPEGCASILWKSAEKAPDAAEALGITSGRLRSLGLIDEVIPEPAGAAHRDHETIANSLGEALERAFDKLRSQTLEKLLERRYERLMRYSALG